jgi:hypothetical protein
MERRSGTGELDAAGSSMKSICSGRPGGTWTISRGGSDGALRKEGSAEPQMIVEAAAEESQTPVMVQFHRLLASARAQCHTGSLRCEIVA